MAWGALSSTDHWWINSNPSRLRFDFGFHDSATPWFGVFPRSQISSYVCNLSQHKGVNLPRRLPLFRCKSLPHRGIMGQTSYSCDPSFVFLTARAISSPYHERRPLTTPHDLPKWGIAPPKACEQSFVFLDGCVCDKVTSFPLAGGTETDGNCQDANRKLLSYETLRCKTE